VAFYTLGCKLNQFESYDLEGQFRRRGFTVVPFSEKADVYVVNTCTVTGKSDYRCRQTLRKARRRNPGGTVIAVGCYAQTQPGVLAGMPEVDFVVGNREKDDLFSHINLATGGGTTVSVIGEDRGEYFGSIRSFGSHTRAFVKIQDGCDSRCSYCIVPFARGPNRSREGGDVLRQLEVLIAEGYREIVLTGVHLGSWGRDLGGGDRLASLLKKIIALPGLGRLRLSSIEPREFSPDLIEALTAPEICPHLHIPLQSGSAAVLRAMGRPYGPGEYRDLVVRLTEMLPDMAVGADVIAGFPGEGEKEYEETRAFIESLPLAYLHVFPYSKRPGTRAAAMDGQVVPEEREKRAAELRALGRNKAETFRRDRIGKIYEALIETQPDRETGLARALTGNYLRVLVDAPKGSENTIRAVRLTRLEGGRIYGETAP
jgi:threonylcarbamoyladenosine tRNA methylthiotransferase MtaB